MKLNQKISQYADDTDIMLEGDRNSFERTVKTTDTFGGLGLFLNAGKTSAIWLGSRRNLPIRYMPHLNMEWNPLKFKNLVFGLIITKKKKKKNQQQQQTM